jgi:hypothetical protein
VADKEFELEDPFQPVAVQLPTPGYDGLEAMARCFVEEYAMLGWPPEKIFRLFTIPEFAGSHAVLIERGPAFVRSVIEAVFGHAFEGSEEGISVRAAVSRASLEGERDGPGL